MLGGPKFHNDPEFTRLIARGNNLDLTLLSLEMARDEYPDLDFAPTLDWINQRVSELTTAAARSSSELEIVRAISESLGEGSGLQGNKSSYNSADSSYINRVVETKSGLPIALSVIYMAVAKKLGVQLEGIAAPMHFITRLDCAEGIYFVDAFSRGRVLSESACAAWIHSMSGLPVEEVHHTLRPASTRIIVVRMLNNLKALFSRSQQWDSALRVQRRLLALRPAEYSERYDHALIALRSSHPGESIGSFESCLKSCPDDERETLQAHLADARRQVADWN